MPLRAQYERIESQTAAFSRATGISCPSGCGECCETIDFAVSSPEAERVAEFLLDERPDLLAKFEAGPVHGFEAGKVRCPFYDPDNLAAHCTVYEARPLLCRAFAFSGHRGKDGVKYAPCHRFRETPEGNALVEKVQADTRAGRTPALPILSDEWLVVWSLDPASRDALPMGPSVRRALESLRMRRSLTQS